jgi:hypothetical protein
MENPDWVFLIYGVVLGFIMGKHQWYMSFRTWQDHHSKREFASIETLAMVVLNYRRGDFK